MAEAINVMHEKTLTGCVDGRAHGPFVASCDDDFEPKKLLLPLPEEESYKFGYCGTCYAPMRWDRPTQRLVMWEAKWI